MKARHKKKVVDVWEVSQTGEKPDWVQVNFDKGCFTWDARKLKCMMAVFKPSAANTFIGGNTYGILYADIGDFIDGSTGDILSPKKFAKRYELIEE